MVQYAFTPWRDRRELLGVRRQFYPDLVAGADAARREQGGSLSTRGAGRRHRANPVAQRTAVARVSFWMQRGGCPHMVESTALLVAAALRDSGASPEAAYAARAAYAAAFSRFVTGLLDGQQAAARKLSMYSVARSIGLPAAFVELRHQATHESLPSLARLRAAARRALVWIWQYYWVHLGPVGAAAEDEAETEEAGPETEPETGLKPGPKTKIGESAPAPEETASTSPDAADACRTAVLRYVDDTSQRPVDAAADAAALAQHADSWGEARVLAVLADVRPGSHGHGRFLRCLHLSQVLMQGRTRAKEKAPEGNEKKTKAVARKDAGSLRETRPEEPEVPAPNPRWTRYEGAWKPRPIGVA